MGQLYLEACIRLHFVSPLEEAREWFEYIRKMWILCLHQGKTVVSSDKSKKRHCRNETVNPVGNEDANCRISKALAKKRRMMSRLPPF